MLSSVGFSMSKVLSLISITPRIISTSCFQVLGWKGRTNEWVGENWNGISRKGSVQDPTRYSSHSPRHLIRSSWMAKISSNHCANKAVMTFLSSYINVIMIISANCKRVLTVQLCAVKLIIKLACKWKFT